MSFNQVNSSGELERVAGLVNSEKINEMYEAFPSDASASNKLVTENDTNSTTLTSTDTLASWVGNAKGVMTAFIGTSSKPSDIGSPLSSWGETMIWCIGDGIRKTLFAIDFSVTQHVIYTREYYNGSFITNWTAIKDGNLTSSVTSGSTAPITSGGVYDAIVKRYSEKAWYPTELGLSPGVKTVTELCNAINSVIGSDCCIHFAWDSSNAISLTVNGNQVSLAGSIIQGHFENMDSTWKLSSGWFTDEEGNMYSFRCRTQSATPANEIINKLS